MRAAICSCVAAITVARLAAAGTPAPPPTPNAAVVLANVQQFYAHANRLTAQFRQIVTSKAFGTKQISDGRLWVSKPNQLRWDYSTRRGQGVAVTKTFIFDGAAVWAVDHDNMQVIKSAVSSSVLPAAVAFLTGSTTLASQFDAKVSGFDAATITLELTPKQPSAQYAYMFFTVATADWHVGETVVVASNGDMNDFTFFAPDLTTAVKPAWFQVDPASLPGYKLITRP